MTAVCKCYVVFSSKCILSGFLYPIYSHPFCKVRFFCCYAHNKYTSNCNNVSHNILFFCALYSHFSSSNTKLQLIYLHTLNVSKLKYLHLTCDLSPCSMSSINQYFLPRKTHQNLHPPCRNLLCVSNSKSMPSEIHCCSLQNLTCYKFLTKFSK